MQISEQHFRGSGTCFPSLRYAVYGADPDILVCCQTPNLEGCNLIGCNTHVHSVHKLLNYDTKSCSEQDLIS